VIRQHKDNKEDQWGDVTTGDQDHGNGYLQTWQSKDLKTTIYLIWMGDW
jgi:hypothetical protein